ncbi:MAG TPA: VC0807 family protein [Thermomicrobiales bacterium]|nr:VC0807 family protein [Thermomicrobiales bacterium]
MLNLLFTVVIPVIILTRFGSLEAFLVALAFPIGFGIYEVVRNRRISWQSGLGIFSLLLTGGFKILHLPPEWVAVKEAMVPSVLALAVLVSAWVGRPLARLFLNQILDREKIDAALAERGNVHEYERRTSIATYLLAFTFLLSATLNFILAKVIVTSDPSTSAYNHEIGRMTALSFPVITIPVMVSMFVTIIYIMWTVSKLTGLEAESVIKQQPKKPKRGASTADQTPLPAADIIDVDGRTTGAA